MLFHLSGVFRAKILFLLKKKDSFGNGILLCVSGSLRAEVREWADGLIAGQSTTGTQVRLVSQSWFLISENFFLLDGAFVCLLLILHVWRLVEYIRYKNILTLFLQNNEKPQKTCEMWFVLVSFRLINYVLIFIYMYQQGYATAMHYYDF